MYSSVSERTRFNSRLAVLAVTRALLQEKKPIGTLIHRIDYFANGQTIATALWTGPLEGIVEKAKAGIVAKGAVTARIVVEATEEEVWVSSPS